MLSEYLENIFSGEMEDKRNGGRQKEFKNTRKPWTLNCMLWHESEESGAGPKETSKKKVTFLFHLLLVCFL